jgi:hypothetical protein
VSKRKQPRRLPLDDPRWWTQAETLQHCQAQPLFRLADLVAAVRQEDVACKFEYRDERTQPVQLKAFVLTAAFFEREADIDIEFFNSAWVVLKPRKEEVRLKPHTLSFWEPDLKKFWPDRAAVPADESPSRKPGPKPTDDWPDALAIELIQIALNDPKVLKNIDALVTRMQADFAERGRFIPQDPKRVREEILRLLKRDR